VDPGGLATWTTEISSKRWEFVVDAILNSGECIAGSGDIGVPGDDHEECGDQALLVLVEKCHCRVLQRPAESQQSVDGWVTYLPSNTVKDLVRVGILSAEKCIANYVTNQSAAAQAGALYDVLLDQPADAGASEPRFQDSAVSCESQYIDS
jgi:hypothetical protein